MRTKNLIPALLALLLPASVAAQEAVPDVNPTATYTDNEGKTAESDKDSPQIKGQAPLAVTFAANPTNMGDYTPTFEWHFRQEGEARDFMVRYEEVTDYTFTAAGTTKVVLRTTLNNGEAELDSIVFSVTVSESKLTFPNAFSPNNGDSDNNIYKAKEYQSIVEFHAYIFNRWGQQLYDWTDPAEGWDGTYRGKDVKEGVYFLLCRAKGADGQEYVIRKDVNLLRSYYNE